MPLCLTWEYSENEGNFHKSGKNYCIILFCINYKTGYKLSTCMFIMLIIFKLKLLYVEKLGIFSYAGHINGSSFYIPNLPF